jgi:hypothetical protein
MINRPRPETSTLIAIILKEIVHMLLEDHEPNVQRSRVVTS